MKINCKTILLAVFSLLYLTVLGQPNFHQKKMRKIEKDVSVQKNQFLIINRKRDSIEKVNTNRFDSIEVWQKTIKAKLEIQNSDNKGWFDFFKDLFVEIAGAFVGALAAICIFISQQKREKIKEENKKRNEDKERVMYMKELSKSTVNITKPWAEGLVNVSEKIKANTEEIPLLPMVPTQDIDRLLKLFDNESYFHAFLSYFGSTDENIKKYKSISHAANFIIAQIKQAYDTHHNALTFDDRRKLKFQELYEANNSFCAELSKSHPNTVLKSVFDNHLVNYHMKYTYPTNLQNIEKDYIKPLFDELLSKWSSDDKATEVLSQLKELRTIHDDIIRQNYVHSENSKEFGLNLTKALTEIENQIQILDKMDAQ